MRERRTCLIRIANRRCLNDDRERNQIGTRAQLRRCKMLWLVEQSCKIWEINQGRWHWHITLTVNLWRLGRYAHLLSLSHRFSFLLFLFFYFIFFPNSEPSERSNTGLRIESFHWMIGFWKLLPNLLSRRITYKNIPIFHFKFQ